MQVDRSVIAERSAARLSLWDLMRWNTGPFLSITAEDVGPARSGVAHGYVGSVMIFPDDPLKQDRAIAGIAADSILKAMPDDAAVDKQLAVLLRKAPEPPEFDDDLRRRFSIGVGIGNVVVEILLDFGAVIR